MSELWVARDGDEAAETILFTSEPIMVGLMYYPSLPYPTSRISPSVSKRINLRPGECKRLVLAEETSE